MNTPQPGDVIRLEHSTDSLIKDGSCGVINSSHFGMDFDDGIGPRILATFNLYGGRAYRDEYVDASGGPCPFIPLSELVPAGTTEQAFWKFRNGHKMAHNDENYSAVVNLWTWKDSRN